MIFALRLLIFSALILAGFAVAVQSIIGRKVVAVIYTFALLWYTFLCRLPIFTATPTYGNSTAPVETVTPTTAEKIVHLIVSVFGSQPDGTLAGGGVIPSLVFNAMLFIPLGYLLLIWFPQLCRSWKGRLATVAICTGVSILIELLQEITGLGMMDWKDVFSNTLGGVIGIVMVMLRRSGEKQSGRGV